MLQLWPIFVSVFLAEFGDKTQISTALFASNKEISPWGVFLASAGALVLSSALAVFFGSVLGKYLNNIPLKLIAGLCFMGIGAWNVYEHFQR